MLVVSNPQEKMERRQNVGKNKKNKLIHPWWRQPSREGDCVHNHWLKNEKYMYLVALSWQELNIGGVRRETCVSKEDG